MSVFRGNIDNWLRQCEPDYYSFFLRAWIPFNAWYVAEMPQHNKKDRLLIKELQENMNSRPRLRIQGLLTNDDYESENFKYHLSLLHYNLEKKNVSHDGKKLSFCSITLTDNPVKHSSKVDKKSNRYKAEVQNTYYEALIVAQNGKTLMHYKHPGFDIEHLRRHIKFIGLADKKIQEIIAECYANIDPNKPTNLVTNSKKKGDYIFLNSDQPAKFVNDQITIGKAIIGVLYMLRCMLFHGEIDPTDSNKVLYEHSYYLLRLILKDLN